MKALHQRTKLFLFLVLSLLIVLAACGTEEQNAPDNNDGNDVEQNEGGQNGTEAEGEGDHPSYYSVDPATVRLFTAVTQTWPYKEDWPVWRWIEESTNIKVDVSIPTGDFIDTLALNVASGDLQDLIYVPDSLAGKYGADGILLDLSEHMDKLPNVQKYLDENPQLKSRVTAPDGEIYHILINGAGITNYMIMFYREDIFEKHNLTPPTTWDELYEVSKQLKELYPSSYPFIYRHGLGNLQNFAPAFGTFPSYFPDPETGEARYGPVEEEFKTMISYLHDFYREGLSPPDFLSMDAKAWTQAMVSNQSFITVQYIGQMEIVNNQLSEGRLVFLPPPIGTGDNQYIADTNYERSGFAINSQSENLEEALKLLDFYYSEEGIDVLSWGKEGETYTIQNGERVFNPEFTEFTDLRRELGLMTQGTYGNYDTDALISMIDESEQYAYEEAPKYAFPVQVVIPNLRPDEGERYNLLNDSINTHYEEAMARFIMGERSLDEWDAYVEEAYNLGLEEMIELHQTAWDRRR
ncbi:extracellular solute-binding protein [Paenibacillus sp. J2TS4]|uniref:extracellular solute-binding protein n=1 Tax=Paenibacillus sp. J2TS4 TaxID=2807194 RepID=UPI001B0612BC|nr:extracellular solute-binding protein [Paenibacillus sp. J2TS4]GIP33992.1 sugar ABC transporter substrate-binding protein [Paenibacillus sp. J2TS4]